MKMRIKKFESFTNEFEDGGEQKPIGINNLVDGINGMVYIFSPLEEDSIDDWNNDPKIQKWVSEERVILSELSYDTWQIYGIEDDSVVKNYIMKRYSW